MKKGMIAIMVLLGFVVAMFVGSAMAQKTKSGDVKDVFKIADKTFTKMKKSPVEFHHKQHSVDLKIACTQCHHNYKNGKNVWKEGDKVVLCAQCHKLKREGKVLDLRNAFHKNCKDCHKKEKKGPTKCNECHPKKK